MPKKTIQTLTTPKIKVKKEIKNVDEENTESLETSSSFLPTYPLLFSEELSNKTTVESVQGQEDEAEGETEGEDPAQGLEEGTGLIKKKRGRKPKPKVEELLKVVKKRGRKPKVKTIQDEELVDDIDQSLRDLSCKATDQSLSDCKATDQSLSDLSCKATDQSLNHTVVESKQDAHTDPLPIKVTKSLIDPIPSQNKPKNKYSLLPIKAVEYAVKVDNVVVKNNEAPVDATSSKYSQTFDRDTYIICLKITEENLNSIIGINQNLIDKEMEIPIKEPAGFNISEHNETGTTYNNNNHNKANSIAYYMETYFNNIYSQTSAPINYKVTMPKVFPETANFNTNADSFDLSREATGQLLRNLSHRDSLGSGSSNNEITESGGTIQNIKNLAKINLSSQISGKWINRRVDDILPAFRDKEGTWPQQSPYVCWNCTENFEGPPIGIPDRIEGQIDAMNMDGMKFYLYGNFCGFSCAARYLFDTVKDSSIWEKYSMLNVLHARVYGLDKISKVTLAPEKILLKKFGGYLTVEAYRVSHLGNREYQVFKPPMIPILYQMEESINDRSGSQVLDAMRYEQTKKTVIPMDTEKVERKLKLKRLKPVKGSTPTLDVMMNIRGTCGSP